MMGFVSPYQVDHMLEVKAATTGHLVLMVIIPTILLSTDTIMFRSYTVTVMAEDMDLEYDACKNKIGTNNR